MFDHKHPAPYGSYLLWSGEFVGKYLISAVQDLRMSHDSLLKSIVAEVVHELIGYQERDGYLGPFDFVDTIEGPGGQTIQVPSRIFGNNWDVWGHFHCVLGLFEWFLYSGDNAALGACLGVAAHLARSRRPVFCLWPMCDDRLRQPALTANPFLVSRNRSGA
jgi:DUF1680 family protein